MQMLFIVFGIIFIGYFLCIQFFAGHGTNFYMIWLLAGVLFILAGICMRKGIVLFHIPVFIKRTLLLGIAFLGILFVIAEGFIISGFTAKGEKGLDYIIVLGAQIKANGPSKVLKLRLDKAYDYLVENPDTQVIVSGGQGSNEPVSEAEGMYDYLVSKGIAAERIIKEDESKNTYQNLKFSGEYLDKERDSVGIVTNNFHVFRAMQLAKKGGYEHVSGIAAEAELSMQANNMLREFLGVMKDWLFGNM